MGGRASSPKSDKESDDLQKRLTALEDGSQKRLAALEGELKKACTALDRELQKRPAEFEEELQKLVATLEKTLEKRLATIGQELQERFAKVDLEAAESKGVLYHLQREIQKFRDDDCVAKQDELQKRLAEHEEMQKHLANTMSQLSNEVQSLHLATNSCTIAKKNIDYLMELQSEFQREYTHKVKELESQIVTARVAAGTATARAAAAAARQQKQEAQRDQEAIETANQSSLDSVLNRLTKLST